MLLDERATELPLPVHELDSVPFQRPALRAGRPQLLPLPDELSDLVSQLFDVWLTHEDRVSRSPVDRMWKVRGNSRNVRGNFPPTACG